MTIEHSAVLELDDIQGPVLRNRPLPYFGTYLLLRIDDPTHGREMLRLLTPRVASAANWHNPPDKVWINLALTFQGLKALGVPQASLESFSEEFQQGMAARAEKVGDVGESAPANWEEPFGTPDVHVALAYTSGEEAALEHRLDLARTNLHDLPGVSIIYQLDTAMLPTVRTHFGYRDGVSTPLIEGSGLPGLPGQGPAIKAGEFILGYPDETGNLPPMPQPEVLGRNGTYAAIRKLHTKVAAWHQYLHANSASPEEEALLAAKMIGRWPSGAPLVLSPEQDDPELGADYQRNNDFLYRESDDRGFKCPAGAHIRRVNPRDADIIGVTRLHRLIRRGTTYGPPLPAGVLEDDGADRGLVGVFLGAHLDRQFEFIKTEWVNQGNFIGYLGEQDPVAGRHTGADNFTIPEQPVRRRLQNLPGFVVTRGGEYGFVPGLRALRWLADLDT